MSGKKDRSVEDKPLMELGEKCRSGQIVNNYLRGIGSEKTELITDPETGKTRLVSKGEALARRIWLNAMGYVFDPGTERYVDTGTLNLAWTKLLLERAEGKAGVAEEDAGTGRPSIADKVSEQNRARLNALAGDDEEVQQVQEDET